MYVVVTQNILYVMWKYCRHEQSTISATSRFMCGGHCLALQYVTTVLYTIISSHLARLVVLFSWHE